MYLKQIRYQKLIFISFIILLVYGCDSQDHSRKENQENQENPNDQKLIDQNHQILSDMTRNNDFEIDSNLPFLDQIILPIEDMMINQGDMQISQDMQIISSSNCPIPRVRQSNIMLRNLLSTPLDASRSYDLDSISQKPISYQWEIIEKPLQSNPMISENNLYVVSHSNPPEIISDDLSTPFAYFLPDQFGKYVISLKVKDETGLESPSENCVHSDETITIEVEDNKIDIQLFWNTPEDLDPFDNMGVDLDLHLFHPILGFNGDQLDWDDSQASCSAINPRPYWSNQFEQADPILSQDAMNGFGPEFISLKSPENTMDLNNHYRIAVRYYEANDGFPPITPSNISTATVVVYIKGKFVGEWTKILNPGDRWEVADLFWTDDDQGIISIDQATTCQPQGIETCDWIDNDCNGLIDDSLSDFPISCQANGVCRQGFSICEFGQETCKTDWIALEDDCRSDQTCCEYGQCVPSSEQSISGICLITCDPSDPFAFNSLRVCEDDEICLSLPQNENIGFCKKADDCGPGSQIINCFDSEICIRNEFLTYCEAIPNHLQPILKDLGEDCDENHFCKSEFVCEFGKCRQACSVGCLSNEICIDLSRSSGSSNYKFCLDTCESNLDCAFEEMCALKEFYEVERYDEDFGTSYEFLSIKVCEPSILHPKQLNEICQTTSQYFYHIASDCAEGLVCIEDYSDMFEDRLTCEKLCEYGDNSCQSNQYCNESLPLGGFCMDQ